MKQLNLLSNKALSESELASLGLTKTGARMTELGGDVRKYKRKVARPFDSRKNHHIVMRSSKAKGMLSMLTRDHKTLVAKILKEKSKKYSIQILQFANVGNHLHIAVKTLTNQLLARKQFANFLREVAGLIALRILKAKKGTKRGKFWDSLVFTKIVGWGKQLKNLLNYLTFNEWEGKNKLIRFGKNPSEGWLLICDPPTDLRSTN